MRTSASDPSGSAGFTLLELLIVVAVLAFSATALGSLAVPRAGASEEAAVRSVVALLREERTAAIASGSARRVVIRPEQGAFTGSGGDTVRVPDARISVKHALEAAAAGVPAIVFFPDGSATGGAISFRFSGSERHIAVHWLTGGIDAEG